MYENAYLSFALCMLKMHNNSNIHKGPALIYGYFVYFCNIHILIGGEVLKAACNRQTATNPLFIGILSS